MSLLLILSAHKFSWTLPSISWCFLAVSSTTVTLYCSSHNGRSASGGGLPVHRHPRRHRPPAVPRGSSSDLPLWHSLLEEKVHSLQGERWQKCWRAKSSRALMLGLLFVFFNVLLILLIIWRVAGTWTLTELLRHGLRVPQCYSGRSPCRM